jgi:hypothetical protein
MLRRNTNFLVRLKDQMWQKVATEMGIPWRSVESMHWQLGEQEMSARANAPVFQLQPSATGTSMSSPSYVPVIHPVCPVWLPACKRPSVDAIPAADATTAATGAHDHASRPNARLPPADQQRFQRGWTKKRKPSISVQLSPFSHISLSPRFNHSRKKT